MESRMMLFLESGDWKRAYDYSERIIDQQPENAMVYVARLMLEYKYNVKSQLKDHNKPLDSENNFNIAYRYANDELKQELDSYRLAVKQRLREESYNKALLLMNSGVRQNIIQAKSIFSSLGDILDAII